MARHTAVLTCLLIAATIHVSNAQAPSAIDAEADRLFHHVMSPYCVGRVLATCPSGQAEILAVP